MTESRKQFTAEQKVAILRRHLLEHAAASDLGDEYHIQTSGLFEPLGGRLPDLLVTERRCSAIRSST